MFKSNRDIARVLIFGFVILSLFLTWNLQHIRLDYNIENFFPKDDEELNYYVEFSNEFENNLNQCMLAIENQEGVFKYEYLKKLRTLEGLLKEDPFVRKVISPASMKRTILVGNIPIQKHFLKLIDSVKEVQGKEVLLNSNSFAEQLVSKDRRSMMLLIHFIDSISDADIMEAWDKSLAKVDSLKFDNYYTAGRVPGQKYVLEKMSYELTALTLITIAIIILFLWIGFRNWVMIIVPLYVIFVALAILLNIMIFLDKGLYTVMIIIPTIIFIVGISDVVHMIDCYKHYLAKGFKKLMALKFTFNDIGKAMFLTSLTSSIGFISLITNSIKPINDFGIYAAIGVVLTFIVAMIFFSACLYILPKNKVQKKGLHISSKKLTAIFDFIYSNPARLIVSSIILLIVLSLGCLKLETNNYFTEEFDKDDPHFKDFMYFEEQYGGVRPFQMIVTAKSESASVLDLDIMKEVDKLETYLKQDYGLSTVMSPASLIKSIHQSRNGGKTDEFKLSENIKEYKKDIKVLNKMKKRKAFLTFLSKDGKRLRISGKMKDVGAIEAGKRNEALNAFYNKNINSDLIEYRLTGISEIIDSNNKSLVSNLALGLAISLLSISLIMGFVFRSFKMVLITLLVNIAPLMMIAGLIGWFDYHLTVSTSIIFTIAFGIAVDDSIHILSRYKIYQSYSNDRYIALRDSFVQSGKAILITTFIISAGFMALMFSDFKSIAQTGLFVSLCLLFALILDLLLLPAILIKVFGIKRSNP